MSNVDVKPSGADWRDDITSNLRKELIENIVLSLFPAPDSAAMRDNRMNHLIAYAKRIENKKFEMANSKSEYLQLIVAKILHIQKELEETRKKRLGRQQIVTSSSSAGELSEAADVPEPSEAFPVVIESAAQHRSHGDLPTNDVPNDHQENAVQPSECESSTALEMLEKLLTMDITALVSDILVPTTKEWQKSLTLETRIGKIKILVWVPLPRVFPSATLEKRIELLVQHAKNLEIELFTKANSLEEYNELSMKEVHGTHTRLLIIRGRKEQRMQQIVKRYDLTTNELSELFQMQTRDKLTMFVTLSMMDLRPQGNDLIEPVTKEWQKLITLNFQIEIVRKIVQLMISMSDVSLGLDYFIQFAKAVVVELYQSTNSLDEYKRTICEKVYTIEIGLLDQVEGVQEQNNKALMTLPDCIAARKLMSHFKGNPLRNCKDCRRMMISKYQRFASQYFVPKRQRSHSAVLKHSCCCEDQTCQRQMCLKMKRAIAHTKGCRNKDPHMLLCREVASFFLHHMTICTQNYCILPLKCGYP